MSNSEGSIGVGLKELNKIPSNSTRIRDRSPFNPIKQMILEYETEYGQLSSNCMFDEEEFEYDHKPHSNSIPKITEILLFTFWIVAGIIILHIIILLQ